MAITQHEALGWEGRWGKLKKKPCIKFKGVEQPVGGGGWGWGWGGNPKIMNVYSPWSVTQVHFSPQVVRSNKASISTFNIQK